MHITCLVSHKVSGERERRMELHCASVTFFLIEKRSFNPTRSGVAGLPLSGETSSLDVPGAGALVVYFFDSPGPAPGRLPSVVSS